MRFAQFRTRRWLPRGRLARQTRGLLLGGVWLRCVTLTLSANHALLARERGHLTGGHVGAT